MGTMLILVLEKHLMWFRPNGNGGTNFYYYYDEITWIVGALALAWLVWFFVRRYRRARALRRPPRRGWPRAASAQSRSPSR